MLRPKATATGTNGSSGKSREGGKKIDRRVQIVLAQIDAEFHSGISVEEMAQRVGLSPGRLAHLFKQEMGMPPQHYLNTVRLEKAKESLESGVLTVKEIAAAVGVPNVSRLCRTFKAAYGVTPGAYRKIPAYRSRSELPPQQFAKQR